MRKYTIDLGDDKLIVVPPNIQHKIIVDHLSNAYQWVFGISGIIIGFLLGIIATR